MTATQATDLSRSGRREHRLPRLRGGGRSLGALIALVAVALLFGGVTAGAQTDEPTSNDGQVIYAAPAGGNRVVQEADGQCHREYLFTNSLGTRWYRSLIVTYESDEEGCRQAAWHAYQRSIGEELTSTSSEDFPTGHPPALTDFSCPSGWQPSTDDNDGTQWCSSPINETVGLSLSPERAREFVRLGLRPSDAESMNELHQQNYLWFVYGPGCDQPGVYKYIAGVLSCDDPRYPPLEPGLGDSHTDRRAPATGTPIPLEAVRDAFVPAVYDSELGRYTSRGHFPFKRNDDGSIVTRERGPGRHCESAYWDENLSQWVCTRDGAPTAGIKQSVVKEWDPDQGIYAIKLNQDGHAVTVRRDPERPCASASWHRTLRQWVCTYELPSAPQQPQQPSAPTPVVHPEASQTIIPHHGRDCFSWSLNGRRVGTC